MKEYGYYENNSRLYLCQNNDLYSLTSIIEEVADNCGDLLHCDFYINTIQLIRAGRGSA